MEGPRDLYAKGGKSNRERQLYDITYMWNLKKMTQMNLFREQKQTPRHRKQSTVTKGESGEG